MHYNLIAETLLWLVVLIESNLQVGYEFEDRNFEFLNQPDFYIPFTAKIHLPKLKWKKHPF